MSTKHIQGVGVFHELSDCWESEPEALRGAILSIESITISPEAEARAKAVCSEWLSILQTCFSFIEQSRERYHLQAREFSGPNVFIQSGSSWSVYFGTELEFESIVGVEFSVDEPFQLIIGD